jgi:isocitrate lyase
MLQITYQNGEMRLLNVTPSFFDENASVSEKIKALQMDLGYKAYKTTLTRNGDVVYENVNAQHAPNTYKERQLSKKELTALKMEKKELRRQFKNKSFDFSILISSGPLVQTSLRKESLVA